MSFVICDLRRQSHVFSGYAHIRHFCMQPLDKEYMEILHLFGDSEAAAFSVHNLLQAGNGYELAAGSWVGPYAMCRTWESLVRSERGATGLKHQPFPMAVYVVSGDEDGERGGAPVVCVEDASKRCSEFSKGRANWTPILLLVPLVLGLDKVNPRYLEPIYFPGHHFCCPHNFFHMILIGIKY